MTPLVCTLVVLNDGSLLPAVLQKLVGELLLFFLEGDLAGYWREFCVFFFSDPQAMCI